MKISSLIIHQYTVSTQYLHSIYTVSTQVRRELYSQCFDEIIRQTTLVCLERGLLLLRTRDECRLTVHACMVSIYNIAHGDNHLLPFLDTLSTKHK